MVVDIGYWLIKKDTKTICIAIACLEYSYLNPLLKYLYVAVAILTTHVIYYLTCLLSGYDKHYK